MKLICLFVCTLCLIGLFAEDAPDPISDKLRFEIAVAQRDYVGAKAEFERTVTALKNKSAEAQSACSQAKKIFDVAAFSCVSPPPVGPASKTP